MPTVYVSQVPAELIVFQGQPELQPITGTSLLWCTNTTSDVIVDEANGTYYVLISGRWYKSGALTGPWTYVPSANLPVDFLSIPPSSPAGVVLAAVAGTPQAREAVISNSIPQTANVPLSNPPTFAATYDGSPKLAPICRHDALVRRELAHAGDSRERESVVRAARGRVVHVDVGDRTVVRRALGARR